MAFKATGLEFTCGVSVEKEDTGASTFRGQEYETDPVKKTEKTCQGGRRRTKKTGCPKN